MGHIVFVLLHLVVLLFFTWALILTIPLHVIYATLRAARNKPDPNAPHWRTHLRCPECRELVRCDATTCRHCHTALDPKREITKADRLRADQHGFVVGQRAATPPQE